MVINLKITIRSATVDCLVFRKLERQDLGGVVLMMMPCFNSTAFQPYRDLEARAASISKIVVARPGLEPRSTGRRREI